MALDGTNTYQAWAQRISMLSNKIVSKQGLFDRMGVKAVNMVKMLLEERLKTDYNTIKDKGLFQWFDRVILQDSTTFHLPDSLVRYFPGNKSNGKQRALVRIQSGYDIKHNQFCFFGLTPYTANDQSASCGIKNVVRKGDIIIRDLGYFVVNALEIIIQANAFFLTRLHFNICVYKPTNSTKKLNLLQLINNKVYFDGPVLLSKKSKLKVRLVALKLPEPIAAERRRKARQQRDKRFTYSTTYLKLLGYVFYATNVDNSAWTTKDVVNAYRLRWKIEIIFKTWKSHFQMQNLIHKQCFNIHRVYCIIYLMLLFITLFQTKLYRPFNELIKKKYRKSISILKLSSLISKHFIFMITSLKSKIIEFLIRYSCYETRSDRLNLMQLQHNNHELT